MEKTYETADTGRTTYPIEYALPRMAYENKAMPGSDARYKPGDRVWVPALKAPAVVLYGMSGGFVQIDTGHGPVLLYEEDVVDLDRAMASGETESAHDRFFDGILPEFHARFIAALSEPSRKAYFKYADRVAGTGNTSDVEPEGAASDGRVPW